MSEEETKITPSSEKAEGSEPKPTPPPETMPASATESGHSLNAWLPFLLGALSVVLIVVGIILVIAFLGQGRSVPLLTHPTATPTASNTPSPTATTAPSPTPTLTPTITPTPSPTFTPTPSEPFEYTVQEGDTLVGIAKKFKVDLITLMLLNNLNNKSTIFVGQKIIVPAPSTKRPTPTPLPTFMPKGYKIQYFVLPNDTLEGIAAKFHTTVDAIVKANDDLKSATTSIYVGQILIVPVNLATPAPTPSPTP